MKIAVLSDIHGNLAALLAVFRDAEQLGITEYINLGDCVGYGDQPEEVVSQLVLHRAISIQGNHEKALFNQRFRDKFSAEARKSLEVCSHDLSPAARLWLTCLPTVHLAYGARFVHGMPPRSIARYSYSCSGEELHRRFTLFPETIAFIGHTHVCELIRLTKAGELMIAPLLEGRIELTAGDRYICNVGSVGKATHDEGYAEYCLWIPEQQIVLLRRVPFL